LLPKGLTTSQQQTTWAQQLNPVLTNPLVQGSLLSGIPITTGSNVINHKLGRQMQGWMVVDTTAAVTLYRSAPFNSSTLTLVASGTSTIALWVF